MSDYIGDFLVQFFMYPHWLAIILVALIVGIQLIAKCIIIKHTNSLLADALSVICAAGMMVVSTAFLLKPENAQRHVASHPIRASSSTVMPASIIASRGIGLKITEFNI